VQRKKAYGNNTFTLSYKQYLINNAILKVNTALKLSIVKKLKHKLGFFRNLFFSLGWSRQFSFANVPSLCRFLGRPEQEGIPFDATIYKGI